MNPVIGNLDSAGPMKAGSLLLGFTVLLLVWLSWYVAISGRKIGAMKDRHLRFEKLLGIVVHSEEVLSSSAWMGITTGDSRWQVRYREFEPKLATATQEALLLASDAGATDVVEGINAANAALAQMENKAFELTNEARREEAEVLLSSEEYSHQKQRYAAGVAEIDAHLHRTIQQSVDAETRNGQIAAAIAAIALPLLLFVWIMARKNEDRWLYAQDLGHATLLREFENLAQRNEGLDARVGRQTCQLDESRLDALRLLDEARQRAVELTQQTKDLRQTTELLRASEAELRTLLESVPQFVWVTGPDGLLQYFNQRWMDYTGLTLKECFGGGWLKPIHPEDQSAALEVWKHATKTDGGYTIESRLRRVDGNYRWFVIQGLPLRNESGQIAKWIATCTDIDDQKRFATGLQVTRKSAEDASHVKSEFLAYISDEIRTPMNFIIGLTGWALHTPLLGLAISARLVQLMGGRTWFESEEGHGSHFHFTARLGVPATPSPTESVPLPTDVTSGHMIAVDDHPAEWCDAVESSLSLEAGMDGDVSQRIRNNEPFATISSVLNDARMPPESRAASAPGREDLTTRDPGAEAHRLVGAATSQDSTPV